MFQSVHYRPSRNCGNRAWTSGLVRCLLAVVYSGGAVMSGFTKGPWELKTVATSCGLCHTVGSFPTGRTRKNTYACIYDDYPPGHGRPEIVANARLIAAAPDMYEALLELQTAYAACNGKDHLAFVRAEAAIAKAEGKS